MLPKRRVGKSRKRKRRSHHALSPRKVVICGHCNHAMLPHRVCPNCGWYQNRSVVEVEEK